LARFSAAFTSRAVGFLMTWSAGGAIPKAAPRVFCEQHSAHRIERLPCTWLATGSFKTSAYDSLESAYIPFSSFGPVTLSFLSWLHIFTHLTWSSSLHPQSQHKHYLSVTSCYAPSSGPSKCRTSLVATCYAGTMDDSVSRPRNHKDLRHTYTKLHWAHRYKYSLPIAEVLEFDEMRCDCSAILLYALWMSSNCCIIQLALHVVD
jgi:hypothetical protein